MKKVFEGSLLDAWDDITGYLKALLPGTSSELDKKRVRITVEDLPESKPEKNCGNCDRIVDCALDQFPDADYACWQPKSAEPQGWEQRLKTQFPDAYGEGPLMAFIRAEIERVREEEKQLVFEWLRIYHSFDSAYAIKENKHREKP